VIKLYSLINGVVTDITNAIKSISSTGDKAQAARKLDITLVYSTWDKNQPRTNIEPGTKIWLLLDGKEIFRGVAWDRGIDSTSQGLPVVVYDYLIYLTKSKVTYNFSNITAEDATKKICSDLGISVGSIATTGIKLNRLIAQKSGYDAIMEMYTQASKTNGKKYIPVMDGIKLSVIEKGKTVANYTLRSQSGNASSNVIGTSYHDTMEGMINKVKIYDSENKYIKEVNNNTGVAQYGLLQDNYTMETDKNSEVVANGMLTGVQKDVTIPALGNWDCRTGYAVNTEISYISPLLKAVMYIDGDTHTWLPGTGEYTMSLILSFGNIMDSKE
jgi:hypothetical protein